jgi:hypothetical protein
MGVFGDMLSSHSLKANGLQVVSAPEMSRQDGYNVLQ